MLGVVGEWPLDPDFFCRVIFAHSGPPIYSAGHSTLHRQLPVLDDSVQYREEYKEREGGGSSACPFLAPLFSFYFF